MPGMTAETDIFVLEKKDLLLVPSKALRFTPDETLLMSYMGDKPKPEKRPGRDFAPPARESSNTTTTTKMVWIKNDSIIHPQVVKTGLDDDINVEITDGLKPGDEVILSMKALDVSTKAAATSSGNPFMPRPPRR
jgi:HlyD family secretion protein